MKDRFPNKLKRPISIWTLLYIQVSKLLITFLLSITYLLNVLIYLKIMTASQVLCFNWACIERNFLWTIWTIRSISFGVMGRVRLCSLSKFITCVVNSLHACSYLSNSWKQIQLNNCKLFIMFNAISSGQTITVQINPMITKAELLLPIESLLLREIRSCLIWISLTTLTEWKHNFAITLSGVHCIRFKSYKSLTENFVTKSLRCLNNIRF